MRNTKSGKDNGYCDTKKRKENENSVKSKSFTEKYVTESDKITD